MPPHPINLPSLLTTALFLLLLLIGDHRRPTLAAVHSLIYAACSPDKYPPNTPYETSLNSLLSSIAASSSNVLYNHFSTAAEPPPPGGESAPTTAYGLYQCRGDLTHRDCSLCVADLLGQMSRLCPSAYGSSVQLDGCFVRYEDTDFVSVPDDGLRYRRCRGGGGGRDFVRRRDGLLEELEGRAREEATGGWFGAVAEGGVEEYAQCLGDVVGPGECGGCVAEAAAEVRRACGEEAAAGEVFLGRCYVRYWLSGYYDGGGGDSDSETSEQDDVGRTVAIIVGAIAGFFVLIILLSFFKTTLHK